MGDAEYQMGLVLVVKPGVMYKKRQIGVII